MKAQITRKKKVLFLSPYPEGLAASQRLKYKQYFPHMREAGYELTTHSFVSLPFWKIIYKKGHVFQKILYTLLGYLRRLGDLFILRRYDVVYVHLWVTPLGLPMFEWLVTRIAKKVVYDIDDMVHTGHAGKHVNSFISRLKGRQKPIALMKGADHVITCTPDLNEFASQYCSNCTDISSTLDTVRMTPAYRCTNDDGPVTIGWTGSHTTRPFLDILRPVFQQLAKERNFRLLVIGNFEYEMEGVNLTYIEWTKEHEVEDLRQMDIGVYPLPTEAWVMGKSGLKALQYMTMAIPAVAQNIGTAIHRVVKDGVNGYLATEPEEWLEKLRYLIDHPEERKRMGAEGRKLVEEKFSIAANSRTYVGILDSLTSR